MKEPRGDGTLLYVVAVTGIYTCDKIAWKLHTQMSGEI